MARYAWAEFRQKCERSKENRTKYAAEKVFGGRTGAQYGAYLDERVEAIDAYQRAQDQANMLGAAAEVAANEILETILANNDAMRGEFSRDSEAVQTLETVARRRSAAASAKKAPSS
jgi:hypothetical protein